MRSTVCRRARLCSAAIGVLLALPGASAAVAQTGPSVADDLARGGRLIGHGVEAPLHWSLREWLAVPAAVGVLAALSTADDDVAAFSRRHQGGVAGDVLPIIEPLGQGGAWILLAGLYTGGLAFDGPGLRRIAVDAAAASVLAAGLVTPAIKLTVGRARPRQREGPYAFDSFSGDASFPSGHTTQAFAVASVVAAESGSLAVDLLAYGLATGVGAARIHSDAHFLTDVLAGAAIGTLVGRGVVAAGRAGTRPVEPVVTAVGDRLAVGLRVPLGQSR